MRGTLPTRSRCGHNSNLIRIAANHATDEDAMTTPGAMNKRKLEAYDEMLAALEAVQTYFVDGCWCTNGGGHSRAPCLLCIANAAIAKAEGR